MARRTKKDFEFQPFESITKNAKHFRITINMLESKAWKELTSHSMIIYLHLKAKYNSHNADDISLTYAEGTKLMNARTFTKSIDQLISTGFIELIQQSWTSREPNIFGFSAMWQKYGTPAFEVKQRKKRTGIQ